MTSKTNGPTPLSPSLNKPKSLPMKTPKLSRMRSYQKTTQKQHNKDKPSYFLLSPLSANLNYTTSSLNHKTLEITETISSYLRKPLITAPKVSNYSEDLNTMMESYFSKKLKEIRTNIAELRQKDKGKMHLKKTFSKNTSSMKKTVGYKPNQKEQCSNSNSTFSQKEPIERANRSKPTLSNTQMKPIQANDKDNNNKQCQLKAAIKEKEKQALAKERREKATTFNKMDKVNGIKWEYYTDNKCVHRMFIGKDDLNNMKKINQSLKELLSIVFKKEVNVNISMKSKKVHLNSHIENDNEDTPLRDSEIPFEDSRKEARTALEIDNHYEEETPRLLTLMRETAMWQTKDTVNEDNGFLAKKMIGKDNQPKGIQK